MVSESSEELIRSESELSLSDEEDPEDEELSESIDSSSSFTLPTLLSFFESLGMVPLTEDGSGEGMFECEGSPLEAERSICLGRRLRSKQ